MIKIKQEEVARSLLVTANLESEMEVSKSCGDKMIIGKDSGKKSLFDIFILLLVAYSCFTTMFYVSFGLPTNEDQIIFDYVVNGLFLIDLLHNFFIEYEDPETFQDVRSHGKIARKYLFSFKFIVDLISTIPWDLIFSDYPYLSALRLFRLFRFPSLIAMLDLRKINQVLASLFEGQQRKEKIMIQYFLLYTYKVFRVIMIASIVTYFMGCIWYLFSNNANNTEDVIADGGIFITANGLVERSDYDKLIISSYFALTTLSTVGYGDMGPVTTNE